MKNYTYNITSHHQCDKTLYFYTKAPRWSNYCCTEEGFSRFRIQERAFHILVLNKGLSCKTPP